MGLFKGRYGHISVDPPKPSRKGLLSNPNPRNFFVEKVEPVENFYVSLIRYPDAINYEGQKVLITTFDPRTKTELDPHFSSNGGILARFEPTILGWDRAIKAARIF